MLEKNKIYQGDCLEVMKKIDDASVDMILCDLPYGTTACEWDKVIPFEPLWVQFKRIIKNNGNIVLFSNQPFTTMLISSNMKDYKYNWVWVKQRSTGFQYSHSQPMRQTEDICVFRKTLNDTIANNTIFDNIKKYFYEEKNKSNLTYKDIKLLLQNYMWKHYFTKGMQWCFPSKKDYQKLQSTGFFNRNYEDLKREYDRLKRDCTRLKNKINYFPQKIKIEKPVKYKYATSCNTIGKINKKDECYFINEKFPTNILYFDKVSKTVHPTQKPVALLEYLIKTYTKENELVLDNCIGSGTTAIACINTNRNYIGIELEQKYVNIANERINKLI